jgi:hypothetical protein
MLGALQTSGDDGSLDSGMQLPLQQSLPDWQLAPRPRHGASAQYARCDRCGATIAWLMSVKGGWLGSTPGVPPGEMAVTQSFFGAPTLGYASLLVLANTTQ